MPAPTIKPDSATLAAAEALAALGEGDTSLARVKYAEAGAILERDMKARRGGSERQLFRFLAATQYYKGGDYQKAQELARKIDSGALPKNVRGLLPQFLKDVEFRASPNYEIGIRKTLLGLWQQKQPEKSLEVLQEHPYVIPPDRLAFLRASLCQKIGDFRAAALFFASAIRQLPDDIGLVLVTAATPLLLRSQGRLSEAWEYVRYQVELFPHAVTYISASLVSFHRHVAAPASEQKEHAEEQIRYVEAAWDAFQQLPETHRNHPEMRAYMALAFEGVATTWARLGNNERSKAAWEQALKLAADSPIPWAPRGFVTPSSEPKELLNRLADVSTRFAPEQEIQRQLETVGV